MKRHILAVAALTISILGASQSAYTHGTFPEGTLLAMEGKDAITKEECLLFVTEVGFSGPEQTTEQWYATVLTSYSHGGVSSEPITVRAVPTRPGALSGKATNGQDQIAIFLEPTALDLRNAKSFNLKWLHGDHFHSNRCIGLRVHQD